MNLTLTDVGILTALATGITSTLVGGTIKIINVIEANKRLLVAGQVYNAKKGDIRDVRIKEIHFLVNSRLTAALRLVVVLSKKEADRTGLPQDVKVYEQAQRELDEALRSAENTVSDLMEKDDEVKIAYSDLLKLQEMVKGK